MDRVGWMVVGLVALIVLWLISTYNRMVALRNRIDTAWSQIDVQLKRRHDLIPNLVETVKGYAAHERGVFEAVTAARGAAQQAASSGPAARPMPCGSGGRVRFQIFCKNALKAAPA